MKGWLLPVLALSCVHQEPALAAKPAPEITSFLAAKRTYVERVAKDLNAKLPAEVARLFDLAAAGNWRSVSNLFEKIEEKYGPDVEESTIPRELWYVLQEVGGYEVIGFWDAKYTRQFADEIFKSGADERCLFRRHRPGPVHHHCL